MSKLNSLVKVAFLFDKRTLKQRVSDNETQSDWTKKPYKTRKPEFKNLWNSDTRSGQSAMLRGGNTSGVNKDQLLKYFKDKYKLDVGYNNFTDPVYVNSMYGTERHSEEWKNKIDEIVKNDKLPFFESLRFLFSPEKKELLLNEYKNLKKTLDKNVLKPDGNIFIDKEVEKFSPEIIAHELGHAYNYNKSPGKNIFRTLRTTTAGIGLPLLAFLFRNTTFANKNPKLYNMLSTAATLATPVTTLVDEYLASKRGTEAIKELKGTPHPSKLRHGFGTYVQGLAAPFILAPIINKQIEDLSKQK